MSPEELAGKSVEPSIDERVAQLKQAFSQYDGKALAGRANSFSVVMMAAHGDSPDLADQSFRAIEDALANTDFGKMREAVNALSDYATTIATKTLEEATGSPVVIANVVGMLPAVANGLLEILLTLLENTDLPPEILASALFNVLTALDAGKIGRALSAMSDQVQALHAGNIILGGDEPRLRAVFTDFVKRVLDNLDVDAAAGAVIALGEDGEVIAGSFAELAARDPRMVVALARMSSTLAGSMTRAISSALAEAVTWPDELLVEIGRVDRECSDPVEAGRALDSLVTLALRFREANPDLNREALTDVLRAVNTEQLELVLKGAADDLKQAALANPGVRMALEPEEVGRRLNGVLAGFNRSAVRGSTAGYLTRVLGAIDPDELEEALRNGTLGLVDALFSSARLARSMFRAAASGAWKVARGIVNLIVKG